MLAPFRQAGQVMNRLSRLKANQRPNTAGNYPSNDDISVTMIETNVPSYRF